VRPVPVRIAQRSRRAPTLFDVIQPLDRLPGRRVLEAATECPGCGEGSWRTVRRHVTEADDLAFGRGLLELGDELAFELCAHCGLVFLSPRFSPDTLDRYYTVTCPENELRTLPADRETNPRYARRERARFLQLARLVRRHRPDAKLLVDVGALDGASLRPFLDAGARGIVIEPGLDARVPADARIEARPSLDALQAEGLRPDVVISTQTFEHLLSPRMMAGTALQTMGEDGLLVVEVPYDLMWMNFMRDPAEPVRAGHPEHLNFFTSDSLARMASVWGCVVVDVSPGAQIQKYGGLIPSITLVARPRGSASGSVAHDRLPPLEPFAQTLERDRPTVWRALQRQRILGILGRRGRW
jgi:Methyltransferase domain